MKNLLTNTTLKILEDLDIKIFIDIEINSELLNNINLPIKTYNNSYESYGINDVKTLIITKECIFIVFCDDLNDEGVYEFLETYKEYFKK